MKKVALGYVFAALVVLAALPRDRSRIVTFGIAGVLGMAGSSKLLSDPAVAALTGVGRAAEAVGPLKSPTEAMRPVKAASMLSRRRA